MMGYLPSTSAWYILIMPALICACAQGTCDELYEWVAVKQAADALPAALQMRCALSPAQHAAARHAGCVRLAVADRGL